MNLITAAAEYFTAQMNSGTAVCRQEGVALILAYLFVFTWNLQRGRPRPGDESKEDSE